MKANRHRRRRVFPAPQPSPSGDSDVVSVLDERQQSNRTGFQFLGAAASFVILAVGCFALGYRGATDVSLVAGWFCGAFALAWWIAAAAHRLPFFARWTNRTRHLPVQFQPSWLLAAILWFFIFLGGGIWLSRQVAV